MCATIKLESSLLSHLVLFKLPATDLGSHLEYILGLGLLD
jgi:hypothetical protein